MTLNDDSLMIDVGSVKLRPQVQDGWLRSIGQPQIGGVCLRGARTRWLPWFDTYDRGFFNRFRFDGIDSRGTATVIRTTAVSDPDYPFRERRDSSGDLCFTDHSWDSSPFEASLDICLMPAELEIEGRCFVGMRYWFELVSPDVPVHRILDRQTWECGGSVADNTLICRNWMTPPRVELSESKAYSTVQMASQSGLMPGSLWARWSLLPAFDMQYGPSGVMLGWFDQVSLIRTALQSPANDASLHVLDLHCFESSHHARTTPKTIAWSPDNASDVEAANLWTVMHEREATRARKSLNIPEEQPPALILDAIQWTGYRFERSYDHALDVAVEFGLDHIYIDVIWEQMQALAEEVDGLTVGHEGEAVLASRLYRSSMCSILDLQVATHHGGEAGLRTLCQRAAERGVGVLSWMALHLSPHSSLGQRRPELGSGNPAGIFARKESGHHPDSGYPSECWPLNLHAPVRSYAREQLRSVAKRTGLSGYLWDSFSNIGWWQIDYAGGSMCPQYDRVAEIYRDLLNEGLYLMPEGLVAHSSHSAMGMFAGDTYAGDLEAFSYDSHIPLAPHGEDGNHLSVDQRILMGDLPIDALFRALAHRRLPLLHLHKLPREQWDPEATVALKELFAVYRSVRSRMDRREVLPEAMGVRWYAKDKHKHEQCLIFAFRDLNCDVPAIELITGNKVDGRLLRNGVYEVDVHARLEALDSGFVLTAATMRTSGPESTP